MPRLPKLESLKHRGVQSGSHNGTIGGSDEGSCRDYLPIYPDQNLDHKVTGKTAVTMGIWETFQPNILGI